MFRHFKRFYAWLTEVEAPAAVAAAEPDEKAEASPGELPRNSSRPSSADPARDGPAGAATSPPHSPNGVIRIPVSAILPEVAEELRLQLKPHHGKILVAPLDLVVPQLATGEVSLPFQDLRPYNEALLNALAPGLACPVRLPLAEVLKEVGPDQYRCRKDQRVTHIPDDVVGPFDKQGQNFSISTAPIADEMPAATSKPAPVTSPLPPPSAPFVTGPWLKAPIPGAARPTPFPPPAPAVPVSGASLPPPSALRPSLPPPPRPSIPHGLLTAPARPMPVRPLYSPAAHAMPGVTLLRPTAPAVPATAPKPAGPAPASPVPKPAAPVPVAAPEPPSKPVGEPLRLPLSQLMHDWPPNLKQEIVALNAGNAQVALPIDLMEQALRTGQVQFVWKRLCGWVEPPLSRPPSPATAEMLVDLPLKVIAPLFMGRYRPAVQQRKTEVAQDIPEVFGKKDGQAWSVAWPTVPGATPAPSPGGARTPAPASPAMAAPATTPAPARKTELFVDLDAVLGPSAQRFPAREIVANMTKLPGVAGALLAMSDGLLVTSALPPHVKGELVAAFLPQIFGRMGQYSRELAMGGLRAITFSVEAGNWQLVKHSNIYFAVLCRPDKALPLPQLAAIAAELNTQQQ